MVEGAIGKFSLFDEVELESSNVFRGCEVERFLDKVGEAGRVEGVSVDGPVGKMPDLHVLCKSDGELTRSSVVRSHGYS